MHCSGEEIWPEWMDTEGLAAERAELDDEELVLIWKFVDLKNSFFFSCGGILKNCRTEIKSGFMPLYGASHLSPR